MLKQLNIYTVQREDSNPKESESTVLLMSITKQTKTNYYKDVSIKRGLNLPVQIVTKACTKVKKSRNLDSVSGKYSTQGMNPSPCPTQLAQNLLKTIKSKFSQNDTKKSFRKANANPTYSNDT